MVTSNTRCYSENDNCFHVYHVFKCKVSSKIRSLSCELTRIKRKQNQSKVAIVPGVTLPVREGSGDVYRVYDEKLIIISLSRDTSGLYYFSDNDGNTHIFRVFSLASGEASECR